MKKPQILEVILNSYHLNYYGLKNIVIIVSVFIMLDFYGICNIIVLIDVL